MRARLDRIIEEFRALEPEEQERLPEMLKQERRSSERAALLQRIRGKYAHVRTSSEDFIVFRREETKREDSKFKCIDK